SSRRRRAGDRPLPGVCGGVVGLAPDGKGGRRGPDRHRPMSRADPCGNAGLPVRKCWVTRAEIGPRLFFILCMVSKREYGPSHVGPLRPGITPAPGGDGWEDRPPE